MNNFSSLESKPLIEANGVRKTFETLKEPLHVLSNIDLRVDEGEILGIVGASGVGKSTLLHILGGLDQPTEGEVLFHGQNIFNQTKTFLDKYRNVHVGFVFQFFNLLPEFTLLENTIFPSLIGRRDIKFARQRAQQLLEQVGLKQRMFHKPGELSGGENQRAALARALINQPGLILADEPTGNLDTHSSDSLMELIHSLNCEYRQTFVIVTHSQRLVKKMDRVLQLNGGKMGSIQKDLVL